MSVSVEQLTALINYLEANPELAVGRFNRSKEGSSLAKRLWAECAHILNNVSSGCAHKTAASWRLYYNEYKSKLLKKKKMEKAALCATGSGEPAKDFVYTPLQNRLYGILEPYDGEPLAVVQQKEEIPDNSLSPIPSTSAVAGEDHTALPPLPFPAVRAPPPLFPAAAHAAPLHNSRADILRRRRRRRQERLQSDTEEPSPHVRSATASLEAMERLGADATREHARATLRLAAAIERLAAALGGGRPCARGTAGDGQRGG